MKLRSMNTGFTVIELMAVVVIVAILAMVALPAYENYVIRANRALAKAYLMDAAQMQQLFFNDTRTYAADPNELNSDIPDRVQANYLVTFNITTITAPPEFTLLAAPLDTTPQGGDGLLSIDNTGAKEHAGEPW